MLSAPAIVKRKRIWVASDPHFFHSAILGFRSSDGGLIRPGFSDVDEQLRVSIVLVVWASLSTSPV